MPLSDVPITLPAEEKLSYHQYSVHLHTHSKRWFLLIKIEK
ncbi:hypothetical protein CHCC14814_0184 [Bacillus paralicheniformis]|nr:hypothetical protein CHCC14814_0184 [Bacillus paralicheniformis]